MFNLKPNSFCLTTNRFLPWDSLLTKKFKFEKTKPTQYTIFKTDMIKGGLVFLISNFFTNKIFQGRNRLVENNTFSALFAFSYSRQNLSSFRQLFLNFLNRAQCNACLGSFFCVSPL